MENKKKHHKLIFIVIFVGIIAGIIGWSTQFAPTHFQLEEKNYINESIPSGFDGFKIAFISDFDLQSTEDLDYLEKCVKTINTAQCDMVIFGGDLFETNSVFSKDRIISILKSLNVEKGKLAVLGENELKANTEECISVLEESGFEVMRNSAHYIYSNNDKITFAGLENNGNVDTILSDEMKSTFVLTAVHQPDFFSDIQNSTSLLQLSGHSGGGFINIPFIGGIIKFDGSQTYQNGEINLNNHTLFISNGIGMGHAQTTRFMCNPNALIITLGTPSQ